MKKIIYKVIDYYLQHDIFIRFWIFFMFAGTLIMARTPFLGGILTLNGVRNQEFVQLWSLCGTIALGVCFACLPDALVVLVDYKKSHRSSVFLSIAFLIMFLTFFIIPYTASPDEATQNFKDDELLKEILEHSSLN